MIGESGTGGPNIDPALDRGATPFDGVLAATRHTVGLHTREVVFFVNTDQVVTWVSRSVTDVLAWAPEELVGSSLANLFHPDDRETGARVRDQVRAHPDTARSSEGWVMRLRRGDGTYRWMSVNLAPVVDDDGVATGVASAWIDVDDIIRLRHEADITQSRVHAIVDSLFDPHVELQAIRDADGAIVDFQFIDCNTATCDRLGRTRAEIVGCRLRDLDPRRRATGLFEACVATVTEGQPLVLRSAWVGSAGFGLRLFEARGARAGDGVSLTWRDASVSSELTDLPATPESRYQLLAEHPTDVVIVGGTDGVLEWVSDTITGLLGWAPADLVGRPGVSLVHPDDASLAFEVQQAVLDGHAQTVKVRFATAGGAWRWVRVATRPVLNEDGQVIGRVATWRDAEDEVAETHNRSMSDERYRFLIENASDVVFRADPDSVLEWISPSVYQLVGRTPEELVGHPASEFMHPDDMTDLAETIDAVHKGTPTIYRGRAIRADGSTRWVSATVRPTYDDVGELIGSVGAIRDIDDEIRAADALAASERRFHLLANHATDLVAEVDRHGVIRWASPSVRCSLGLDPDMLVGTVLDDLVHDEDRDATAALRQVGPDHDQRHAHTRLVRMRHHDGTYRWMSATATQLPDSETEAGFVVGMRDVDDLVRARQIAESERARAIATFDTFLDPHVVFDAVRDTNGEVVDFTFVEANDAACTYNGIAREDLLGRSLLELLPATIDTGLMDDYRHVLATGEPLILDDFEYPHELLEEARSYDIRASKLGDGLSFTWRDVSERHHQVTQLAARATRDELTGLGNRAAIHDELQRALGAASRSQRPVAILMVDLDHFKNVNDSLGHPVGDELLCAAARRLLHTVRTGDFVGRLGGDEFIVVMRDLDDGDEAVAVAGRVVAAFRSPLTSGDLDFYATASVGIAVAEPSSTPTDLLREADTALYRAKDEGRDRASMFNDDLRERALQRLTIESQLRPALANGELALWYQPEIDLDTGMVIAVEALLRWLHPSGEIYTADRFVEIAEEIGIIHEIGEWVFEQACRQAAAWATARPNNRITVRVNLSALQLAEAGLLYSLDRAIADSGVDPTLLCVEITETAFLHETTTVRANLEALRARGVHIAIDDFGTGYASLAYLREFPIHVIKIDRSFTAAMLHDDYERRLIAGIIALAELLDMRITAEGIEEAPQAELLRELGCTSAQGWLYSKAVPADAVEQLFDHRFT